MIKIFCTKNYLMKEKFKNKKVIVKINNNKNLKHK